MITREADYAIRAVLYLAQQDEDSLVATSELADEMYVPYRFLRRIVQKLVEGGLMEAQRGKGGGIRLAQPVESISLYDVLSMVDPKALHLNSCLQNGHTDCPRASFCTVREHLQGIQTKIGEELQSVTFAELNGSIS